MKRRESGFAQSGFALAETLVAAAIIAGMLGVTLDMVATQARTSHAVEQRRLAALVAQSQLAAAATVVGQLEESGRTGGVDWRVSITPYAGPFASPRLEQITVAAGRGREGKPLIVVRSLRLAG